jgi:putative tryptophan/tyrosine transport system substrate-binding protein
MEKTWRLRRHAVGNPGQFLGMASDLVQMKADVIVTTSAGLASLALQATSTIPIVTATAGDLEGAGLIASLAKPGGNVTGIQLLSPELMSKRVELLKELVPNMQRLGVIVPITPAAIVTPGYLAAAARTLQIEVHIVEVGSTEQFPKAIAAMAREDHAAILIANPLAASNAVAIARAATQNRLPLVLRQRQCPATSACRHLC